MCTQKRAFNSLGGIILLSLMLLFLAPVQGHAATFTVNSTADTAGLTCAPTTTCTLRSAIQQANASVGVADTIILPAGTYTLAIQGLGEDAAATGDLDITGLGGALTISGAGAATTIIDGGAIDGVFETIFAGGQGANATISGVTIRNGLGDPALGHGGGIHVGNGTTLTLNNSVVTANKTVGAAAGASGVDNSGTLHMNTVAVTNNDGPGGGVNNGALGVLDWTIGEVSGNLNSDVANAGGGGIQNNGTITLTNVTISGNTSSGQGAGIDARGTVTLQNVTVAGNTTSVALGVGGVRNNAALSITVRNTIISGNLPANCGGAITSGGNNIDNGTTCGFVLGVLGDLPGTDPLLAPLADNTGAVQTHALTLGSPAIEAGAGTTPATGCPATDARGVSRPQDGNGDGVKRCNIGAFEFRAQKILLTLTPPFSFDFGAVTVNTTAEHIITVTNGGDGDLTLGDIAATDPLLAPYSIVSTGTCTTGFTLKLIPVPANSCDIIARFAPTAIGSPADTFDIPSNDPITPTVTFGLTGTGAAGPVPNITVTDSIAPPNDHLLAFIGVVIGQASDATVTVTNTGTAALAIGTIASPAAPFSITADTCSSASIAPSATCTLTVHFAPTANTQASDTFAIPVSNVPGTTSVTMTVRGSGVSATGNNPPSIPVLVDPADGLTGVPTTMTFVWNKSVDPDGDAVTYHFKNCTDTGFTTGCTNSDVVAAAPSALFFAGLGSLGAGIMLIGFVAAGGKKRSRIMMLAVTFLLLSGIVFVSCHSSSNNNPPAGGTNADQISNIVRNLSPNTTYYWMVIADDGKGGQTPSTVSTYTTGQ